MGEWQGEKCFPFEKLSSHYVESLFITRCKHVSPEKDFFISFLLNRCLARKINIQYGIGTVPSFLTDRKWWARAMKQSLLLWSVNFFGDKNKGFTVIATFYFTAALIS
jgi:hypothetical protein